MDLLVVCIPLLVSSFCPSPLFYVNELSFATFLLFTVHLCGTRGYVRVCGVYTGRWGCVLPCDRIESLVLEPTASSLVNERRTGTRTIMEGLESAE